MNKWISFPRVEGLSSRQAHAGLPEGTYERELGKEGFFGPATHMYHRRPPTAWSSFEGPLQPRAFDTTRLGVAADSPWQASLLLHNAAVIVDEAHSPEDLPAFRRSTVDGYAVRAADTFGASESLPAYLTVVGEARMGERPAVTIEAGQTALIHTGAMIPTGADAVVNLAGENVLARRWSTARKRALLRVFGSSRALKGATVEEMSAPE